VEELIRRLLLSIRTVALPALTVLAALATPTVAQAEDGIAIWQGMSIEWDIANHRWNRLGSMVNPAWDKAAGTLSTTAIATAASGSGADNADVTTSWKSVVAEGVTFHDGAVDFVMTGTPGDDIVMTQTVEVDGRLDGEARVVRIVNYDPWTGETHGEGEPVQIEQPGVDEAVVVLNGFDLVSNLSAKKPQLFSIQTHSPSYDPATDVFSFDITARLRMDCQSMECKTTDDVDYDLEVRWVLAYDSDTDAIDGMELTLHEDVGTSHSWDTETAPQPFTFADTVQGRPGWNSAVLGITRLELELNKEFHMIGLWERIDELSYDPATGAYDFEQTKFFQQWAHGMYVLPTILFGWHWTHFPLAYPDAGTADHRLDLALLQFSEARVVDHSRTQNIDWDGFDASAHSADAVQEVIVVDEF